MKENRRTTHFFLPLFPYVFLHYSFLKHLKKAKGDSERSELVKRLTKRKKTQVYCKTFHFSVRTTPINK